MAKVEHATDVANGGSPHLRHYTIAVLIVAVVCGLVGLQMSFGIDTDGPDTGIEEQPLAAELWIDPESLDFGEVWEDSAFLWHLDLCNVGAEELVISRFHTSCNCGKLNPSRLLIPPGERRRVELVLDLRAGADEPAEARKTVRSFVVAFFPELLGPKLPPRYELRGKVKVSFQLESPAVSFGEVIRGRPFPREKLRFATLLTRVQLGEPQDHVEATLTTTDPARSHYEIATRLNPEIPVGPLSRSITLRGWTSDGRLVERLIPVNAVIVEDVRPFPAALAIGATPLGEPVEELVLLRSQSRRRFAVVGAVDLPKEITLLAPDAHEYSTEADLVLRIAPTQEGEARRHVTVNVRMEGESVTTPVRFPVTWVSHKLQ